MASQKTPIEYTMDFKADDSPVVTMVQHMANNTTLKRKVPMAQNNSIESVLFAMVEFDEAALALVFDADDLYMNFRLILPSTLRDDWDETEATLGVAIRTAASFRACQGAWMASFISSMAAENLRHYIENQLSKPYDDSIQAYVSRCKTLRKRQYQLQSVGQAVPAPIGNMMSRQSLIEGMFRGLPIDWRGEFLRYHRLQTCTIQEFQDGMEHEKAEADRKKKTSASTKRNNNGNKWKTSRRKSRDDRKDAPYDYKHSKAAKSKCRKHPQGNHSWYHCYQNPKGPNYRPPRDGNKDHSGATVPNVPPHQQPYRQGNYFHQQQVAMPQMAPGMYTVQANPGGPQPQQSLPGATGGTQGGTPRPESHYYGASHPGMGEPSSSNYNKQSTSNLQILVIANNTQDNHHHIGIDRIVSPV